MLVKPKSTFTRTTGRLMCGILMASVISFGLSVPVSRAAGDSSAASTASSAPTASIAPTADSGGIEEIIVTAARREQSELTVPISITAFSAKELEANHVTDVEDYFALSPDVYITGAPDRVGLVSHTSGLRLAIRGISDIGGTSNSFGIYLDDLNINNATVNPYLVDIDRIEVLEDRKSVV